MTALKVAMIGAYGHHGKVLSELVGFDAAALVACAPAYEGENIDKVFQLKAGCPDTRRYDDYRKLLEAENPDVAIVSTRLDRIAPVAADAARAGCHLICEKPLALTHESLDALHEAVRQAGVHLCAMLSMRAQPAIVAARAVYRTGRIGEAVLTNARKSYQWGQRPEWFAQRELYGGTFGWVGIHNLDFVKYITGLDYTSVAGMQSNFGHPERPACEDNCAAVLALSNGGHATVSIDLFRPEGLPQHGDHWVRIVGTRGVIEASVTNGYCEVAAAGEGRVERMELGEPVPMYRQFMQSLLDGAACNVQQPGEAFTLTRAALCARDSADTGRVVAIEPRDWT